MEGRHAVRFQPFDVHREPGRVRCDGRRDRLFLGGPRSSGTTQSQDLFVRSRDRGQSRRVSGRDARVAVSRQCDRRQLQFDAQRCHRGRGGSQAARRIVGRNCRTACDWIAVQHSADDDGKVGFGMVSDAAGARSSRDTSTGRNRPGLPRSLLRRCAQIRRVDLALGEREFRAVLPLLPERTAAAPLAEAA